MDITKEELEKIVFESNSKSDVCRNLGIGINGGGFKKLEKIKIKFNLSFEHFNQNKIFKYEKIIKTCPICETEFETKKDHKDEKTTCSHSCANTYFRSGENNPNFKDITSFSTKAKHYSIKYRRICFDNHEHKCCVCSEDKMVDVHHFDENKKNNEPSNLIPICATHHNYLHSKYKGLIIDKVIEYRENFIKRVGYGVVLI